MLILNRFSLFKKIKNHTNDVNLKIPLLLMTAIMTLPILQKIELITGITINRNNFLWDTRNKKGPQHITLTVQMRPIKFLSMIQNVINNTLKDNLDKKIIIYTNTTKCAEEIKDKIDYFLNTSDDIHGNCLLIHRDMYSDVKFLLTVKFTTKVDNPEQLISDNEFYPIILIATASHIGNGLDLDKVFKVTHVGFPTSIVDCVQEMGRCGRKERKDGDLSNEYTLLLNLQDFIYAN